MAISIFNRGDTIAEKNYKTKILEPYLRDYRSIGMFSKLTGPQSSIVWGKMLQRDAGESVVYDKIQNYAPSPLTGDGEGVGQYDFNLIGRYEQSIYIASDMVKLQPFRFDSKLIGKKIQRQQTGHDFWPEVKYDLLEQARKLKERRFKNALIQSFRGRQDLGDMTTVELTDAVVITTMGAGTFVAGENCLSKDRVLMGLSDLNAAYAGTITAGVAAMSSTIEISRTNCLSVEMLYNLQSMASTGNNPIYTLNQTRQSPIEPHSFGKYNNYERRGYVLVTSEKAFSTLRKDPDWKAQVKRGVVEQQGQPSILYGSNYKGTIYDIDIVTDREFENMKPVADNAAEPFKNIRYSVLLGKGAFGFVIGGEPELIEDSIDYGTRQGICHAEISGIKVLKFASLKANAAERTRNLYPYLENGLIHVFSTTTAPAEW